jgi:CRISPR-associated protein (TIGR03986 family)
MLRPILKRDRTSDFFHNPYNFVPALPRDKVTNELGDRQPVGHDRYLPEYWSGSIRVKLTTKTPLLIPDAFHVSEKDDHKTFPLRMLNGKPYLPPTSIKGMLRAAYEVVTNSRLSVFSKHDEPLVYRMSAANSFVYPAVVRKSKDGLKNVLRIMPGYVAMGSAGKLPCYKKDSIETDKGLGEAALPYHHKSEFLPSHQDKVWVKFNSSNDSNDLPGRIKSYFPGNLMKNVVTRICKRDNNESLPDQYNTWHKGIVCISGANIKEKRYERVFIEDDKNDRRLPIDDRLNQLWTDMIIDYQNVKLNQRSLAKRKAENHQPDEYLGHEPGKTAFSRHIYEPGSEKLTPGTLCYIELDTKLQKGEEQKITSKNIKAIIPVIISRHFYDVNPQSLLDRSLQPATKIEELSPADRVFGWTNQSGNGAYRGNLRIHDVCCTTPSPVENFEQGLPLAILGQPQPQQGRFYAAKDDKGTPIDPGVGKQQLYRENQGLRGRKVYPHHQNLPENYWDKPLDDRTQQSNRGTFQEYRRPTKRDGIDKDNQNRSINAWVKPDVTFECSIDVTNLSSVELGALLWLLDDLPADNYHRLGGGKPLGFGSVALSVDWKGTELQNGEQLKDYYSTLLAPPASPKFDRTQSIADFQQAVQDSYGGVNFIEVSFIKAFCQAARGFSDGKPIHYPRVSEVPNPEGESFKWFTANEVIKRDIPMRQYSLGSLVNDPGLPFLTDS